MGLKNPEYKEIQKTFPDKYGIECVECPKCRNFIPNVKGEGVVEIECEVCKLKFQAKVGK